MAKMFNRARMTVTSTGTGALSLGVAVAGYQTFSSAGAQNGDSVSYAVEDGLKWEIGTGTYNSVAGTLSRTVTQSFDGTTYGTSPISVTTSAQVFISPLAADLQYGTSAGNLVQLDGSSRLPAVDGSLVTGLNASNIGTGTLGVARGGTGTGTAFTTGSVVFAGTSGVYTQNNSELYWDNTNYRFGVGTTNPGAKFAVSDGTRTAIINPRSSAAGSGLSIGTDIASTGYVLNLAGDLSGGGTGGGVNVSYFSSTTATWNAALSIRNTASAYSNLLLMQDGGNVGIGTSSPNSKLVVKAGTDQNLAVNPGYLVSTAVLLQSQNNTGGSLIPLEFRSSQISFDIGASTAATIDSSGNVGIGTGSPSNRLHVYRNTDSETFIRVENTQALLDFGVFNSGVLSGTPFIFTRAAKPITFGINNSPAMTLDASGNLALNTTTNGITTQGTGIFTVNGSTGFGQFCIAGDNAIRGPNAGYIIGNTNSNTFLSGIKFNAGSASSGYIGFFVNGNTGINGASVTIDPSGNLLVGTTTAVGRLTVQGPTSGTMAVSITKPNGLANAIVLNSGSTTTDPCILVQGNGTSTAYWLHNGDIYLPGGTAGVKTFSDIKLKRDVTYLDNQNVSGYRGLSEILQLKPVTYNFKSDSDDAIPRKGFVAQDFEQIFPELVSASKIPGDKAEVEYKHISDGGLIPVLVSAIQELAAKVQALEAKVQ